MKNLRKKYRFRIKLKSKHLLVIMTLFCISTIITAFASGISTAPLQNAAGTLLVPFEKSISSIGLWITEIREGFREKQELLNENKKLKAQIDVLTAQNNKLIQNQTELKSQKIPETGMIPL